MLLTLYSNIIKTIPAIRINNLTGGSTLKVCQHFTSTHNNDTPIMENIEEQSGT